MMESGIDRGWLTGVRRVDSPNCDDRPDATDIDLVVIHGISLPPGRYGGPHIDQLFTNTLDERVDPYFSVIAGLKVSAHLLIQRDGTITQYVSFDCRAWHAGLSSFAGRDCCNDFSIGIELEGCDDQPYDDNQYSALVSVLRILMNQFPAITRERICGHCMIAPDRKTDPGPAFDWVRLHEMLAIDMNV